MAKVTSSSSNEGFSTVSTSCAVPVVAPPKFVFGSGMSERVKKKDDDSDTSEKEEESSTDGSNFLDYAYAAVKRSAESEDDNAELDIPDFMFVPKKIMKKEGKDSNTVNVLRPSALSMIADKLSQPKQEREENKDKVKDLAKTHGEPSDSNLEKSTSRSRSYLIDSPAPLNSESQSQNYFQQFISGSSSTSTSDSKGGFVFGENIGERVNIDASNKETGSLISSDKEKDIIPNSLAHVAEDAEKTGSKNNTSVACSSIAAAAQKYESEHSSPKKNLAEIQVMTGEEDERNVIQVSCRLFVFCKDKHSWLGRGRVILKLNDQCKMTEEGTFHSRLVARTQGNLRLVLNTKIWPEMVLEKASDKALRVSAMEDGNINLYLIMVAPREAVQLYTAIDRRIETLKSERSNGRKNVDESPAACGEHETTNVEDKKDDDETNTSENKDVENTENTEGEDQDETTCERQKLETGNCNNSA